MKVKSILVDHEFFEQWFTKGEVITAWGVLEGLPKGASLVGASYDAHKGLVTLTFWHDDFPEVTLEQYMEDGAPILMPVFTSSTSEL